MTYENVFLKVYFTNSWCSRPRVTQQIWDKLKAATHEFCQILSQGITRKDWLGHPALLNNRMKKILVNGDTPEKFSRKVQKALHLGPLGKITKFTLEKDQFVVAFSQLGTSKIYYQIEPHEEGFTASLTKEDVSMMHGMFRKDVEKELTKIMQRFGAEIS